MAEATPSTNPFGQVTAATEGDTSPLNPFGKTSGEEEQPVIQADVTVEEGDSPGLGGTLLDMAGGVVSGAADFAESAGDLATDAADSIGLPAGVQVAVGDDAENGVLDVSLLSREELDAAGGDPVFGTSDSQDAADSVGIGQPETLAGEIVNGVTQFGLGYITGSRLIKAGGTVGVVAKSVFADFVSFDEHEARLSNLVEQFPMLANPVTEYLSANEEDSYAFGRMKNAVEGLGIGAAFSILGKVIKAYKGAALADASGNPELAEEILREAQPDIDAAVKQAADTDELVADLAPTDGPVTVDEVLQSVGAEKRFDEAQIAELSQRVIRGDGNLEDVAEAFNMKRWKSVDEGKEVINEMVDVLRETNPEEFTEVQSLDEVAQMAADLSMDPETLWTNLSARAGETGGLAAEIVAMKVSLNHTSDQLPRMVSEFLSLKELGEDASATAMREKIEIAMNVLAERLVIAKGLQKNVARGLGAGRLPSDVVPGGKLGADELVSIFDYVEGNFDDFTKRVSALDGKPGAFLRAFNWVMSWRTWDVANEVFINGILSGPKTHVVNVMSTGAETLLVPIEGAAGSLMRRDVKQFRADLSTYAGLVHGARDSARMAFASLRQEKNIIDPSHATNELNPHHAIAMRDVKNPLAQPVNALGAFLRLPSRFLAAEDEFFKQINYRARVYSKGYKAALDKGATGKQASQQASDSVVAAFDGKSGRAIDEEALQYSRENTFTNDLEYGMGKFIQTAVNRAPMLRQVIPFVRTPTNLIRGALFKRTPIGLATKAVRDQVLGLNGTSKQAQATAIARMGIGTSFAAWGLSLAQNGVISGAGDSDPNLRRQALEAGYMPYSIRIGDENFSYERGDPRFMMFGIVADYVRISDDLDEDTLADVAAATVLAAANNLSNKSYTQGIGDLIEAMEAQDPEEAARYLRRRLPASVVPYSSIMRQLNPDPVMREVRDLLDGIMAGIPGLSETVEPRRNAIGEQIVRHPGTLYGVPIAHSKIVNDAVKQEMALLGEGFALPSPTMNGTEPKIDLRKYESASGQTAFDKWQELTGTIRLGRFTLAERLNKEVEKTSYQKLPVTKEFSDLRSKRANRISDQISRFRDKAFKDMLKLYPDLAEDLRTAQLNARKAPSRGAGALEPLLNQ